jgi:4-amino-4-deoxy-L-arabinose transferase-like glycosyltransferase
MRAVADGEAVGHTFRSSPAGSKALVGVSIAWGAVVLAVYYGRLWTPIGAGLQAWNIPDISQNILSTGLPHLREAFLRAVSGIASAALVVAAMLASGAVVERWLSPPAFSWYERAVVRFGNGAGVLSSVLLLLAFAGAYRPAAVRVVVAMLAAYAVADGIRTWRPRTRHTVRSETTEHVEPQPALPWIVVTVAASALAFIAALAPEVEYDALWYHLELPRRWLAAGGPVDDVYEYVSLYPLSWELLFGAALSFDGSVAARLLHWTTLIASGVLASSLSADVFGIRTRWVAAAIFVTAPTVFWEATTAYVDLALAMHAGIAGLALWRSTKDSDPRWLVLAGFQLGVACATKHLGLVNAAVAITVFVVARIRSSTDLKRLVRSVALLSSLTFVVPAPWYVRSWLASGNPVFPEMYEVFGAEPPERWHDRTEKGLGGFKDRFGRPRTPATIATLPWDMTMHGYRYGGSLGPFLLLLLPAVVVLVRRRTAARLLLCGTILYLLVWASPVSSYQLRFLVPWWLFVSALIAGGIALLTDDAARLWRAPWPFVRWMLPAIAWLNLPPFTPLHERDREGDTRWLTHVTHQLPMAVVLGGASEEEWLRSRIRSYPAWQFLNLHAPSDARVLTFFGGDHFYARRSRLWSEAAAAWPVTWDAIEGLAGNPIEGLRRLGITHLLVPAQPPDRTPEHDRLLLLQPEVLSRFQIVYEDFRTVVYRVDATPDRRGGSAVPDGSESTDHR